MILYQLNNNLIIAYYYNWKSYNQKSNANTQYHGFIFYHQCCDQSRFSRFGLCLLCIIFLMIQALFKVNTFQHE